jgi:hypothetical protein
MTPEEQQDWEDYQALEEYRKTNAAPQQGFAEGLGASPGEWAKNIFVDAPVNAAKGVYELGSAYLQNGAQGVASKLFPPESMTPGAGVMTNLGEVADRGAGMVAGVIPGGATAYDYAGGLAGFHDPKTPYEYGTGLRQELSNLPLAAAVSAAPALGRAVRGAFTGAKDATLGLPRENLLAAQSVNKDIYANKLNAASKRTFGEDALLQRTEEFEPQFTATNPVAGIDPSKGREAFTQFEGNLDNIRVEGIKKRASILPEVAKAENALAENAARAGMPNPTGVSFDDIPLQTQLDNGLTYGIDHLKKTSAGSEGVDVATQYVMDQFGAGPQSQLLDATGNPLPPRKLSVTELNDVRMKIDGQIREMGGWDDAYLSSNELSPSIVDSQIDALTFYRGQIDKVVKDKIGSLVGPDAAEAFDVSGKNIAMSSTYGPLAGRFRRETGQAFAPGSAKAVPPGSGPLGTSGITGRVLGSVAPDVANSRMQTQALSREGQALRDLQMLVDYKSGRLTMPAPRGWAEVKNNLQHLTTVGNVAMSLGLVNSIEQMQRLPEESGKRLIAQVAQAAPEIFVPPEGNYLSFADGKLNSPIDQDQHKAAALDMPAADRARVIGSLFDGNKYQPATKTQAPAMPQQPAALPATMEKLNQSLDYGLRSAPMEDSSYDQSQSSMLDELNKMTLIHGMN